MPKRSEAHLVLLIKMLPILIPLMPALHLTVLGLWLVMEKLEWWYAQVRPQVACLRHVASAVAKAAQALPLQRPRRHALF